MKHLARLCMDLPPRVVAVCALCAVSQACSGASSDGNSAAGGTLSGAGGTKGGGANESSGGTMPASGGVMSSGGNLHQGGSSDSGGAALSGGASGASGNATGGRATGGSTGIGGMTSGGKVTFGGQSESGGQIGSGGLSATTGGKSGSGGQIASGGQGASAGISGLAGNASNGGTSATVCPSPVLAPGNTTRTIQSGGRSRTYVLHVPSGYTGNKAVPLIVDFHPHGSTGPAWQTGSPYPSVVDGEGVVMAFPSAITDWNVGPCCSDGVDDVAFAKALVAEVKGLGCIDVKRVYAVGFSMGGGMTNYVACNAADVFAAFAPAAFDLLQENLAECKPVRPISVVSFRGTADSYVPYAGGLSNLVRPITFLGAVNTMKEWAEFSGCTGSAADLGNGCQGYAASQCKDGIEVVLCTKQGGGHEAANASLTWPVLKRHALP